VDVPHKKFPFCWNPGGGPPRKGREWIGEARGCGKWKGKIEQTTAEQPCQSQEMTSLVIFSTIK